MAPEKRPWSNSWPGSTIPPKGEILLDGIDLREYDVEDLRREIGVIFQDYMRYDLLVRENIGFGKIEISRRPCPHRNPRRSRAWQKA